MMKISGYGVALSGVMLASSCALAQPPQTTIQTQKLTKAAAVPTLPLVTWDELKVQIGGPTLVTLHADKMPGDQALDELARQASVPIQIQNRQQWTGDKNALTADYEKQPFWEVVRDIAKKLNANIQNFGTSGVSFQLSGGNSSGLVSEAGPFLLGLQSASFSRSIALGEADSADREALSLSGLVYIDPKLSWQANSLFVNVLEASDSKGQSLLLDENRRISGNGPLQRLTIRLNPPETLHGRLKQLRGNVHGVVASQTTKWEVNNVLNAKNVEKILKDGAATTRLELQDVVPENDNYRVTLVVSESGGQNRGSVRLSNGQRVLLNDQLSGNQLSLVDAQGRALKLSGVTIQQNGDRRTDVETTVVTIISATFTSDRSDDKQNNSLPAKLTLRYDWDWRELVVPFAFENVVLP